MSGLVCGQSPDAILAKADSLFAEGELDLAHPLFQEAETQFKTRNNWPKVVEAEVGLAYVKYLMEESIEAEQDLLRAENIMLEHPEGHEDMAQTVFALLSAIEESLGKYGSALEHSRYSLQIEQAFPEPDTLTLADLYNNLGAICFSKADYDQSLLYYQESIRIYEELDLGMDLALSRNNLGQTYHRKSNYGAAVREYENALEFFKTRPKETRAQIKVLNNLAAVLVDSGEIDQALSLLGQAEKLHDSEAKGLIFTYGNLGYAFLKDKKLDKAESYLKQGLNLSIQKWGKFHPEVAKLKMYLGNVYLEMGKTEMATEQYCSGLGAISASGVLDCPNLGDFSGITDRRTFFRILAGLSQSLRETNPELALEYSMLAARQIRSMRSTFFSEESKQFLLENYYPIFEEGILLAAQQSELEGNNRAAEIALELSGMSKSVRLMEGIQEVQNKTEIGIPPEVLTEEKELRIEQELLQKMLFASRRNGDEKKEKEINARQYSVNQKLLALNDTIKRRYPQLTDLGPEEASFMQLEKLRPISDKGDIIIEYFWGDHSLTLIKIKDSKISLYSLDFNDSLGNRLLDFCRLISDFDGYLRQPDFVRAEFISEAYSLYQLLLEEALHNESPERLVIIPDGPVSRLPFGVLLTAPNTDPQTGFAQLPYLALEVPVSYNPSPKGSEFISDPSSSNASLAFAPQTQARPGEASTGQFLTLRNKGAALPAARNEISALAKHYGGTFYFGEQATETVLKKEGQSCNILHLSTHGVLDPGNGMWSYLEFAKEENAQDGKLHAYELQPNSLHAQLAVLSACESGRGNYRRGEGVMSMARGFILSGVPSVVMSLWKVEDQATAELMEGFYNSLAQGARVSTALADAQRNYLLNADELAAFPGFWAGFVMVGKDQTIPATKKVKWWPFALIALSVAALVFFIIRKKRNRP